MDANQYNFSSNQLNSLHYDDIGAQEQRSVNYQKIRSRQGSISKEMRQTEREESIVKQEENMTTFLSDYQDRSRKLTNEGIEKKVGTSDSLDFQEATQDKQQQIKEDVNEEDAESEKSDHIKFRQEISQFTNGSNMIEQINPSSSKDMHNILAQIQKENEKVINLKSHSIDNQQFLEENLQGISPINNYPNIQQLDAPFNPPTLNLISLQKIENSQYQLNPITEQSEDQTSIVKAMNQFSDHKNSSKYQGFAINSQAAVQTAVFDPINSQKQTENYGEMNNNGNSPRAQFQSILSELPRVMLYTVNKGQVISQPSSPIPQQQTPQLQPLSLQQLQIQQQQLQQQSQQIYSQMQSQQQSQLQQQQSLYHQIQANLVNSQNYSTCKSQQKYYQPQESHGSPQMYQIPQQTMQPVSFNDFSQVQSGGKSIMKNPFSLMQDKKIIGDLEQSLQMQMQSNVFQQQQQQNQNQQTHQILEMLILQLQQIIKQKDEQIQIKDNSLNDYSVKVIKLDELFKNVSQQYQNENIQLKDQFQNLQNELVQLKNSKSTSSQYNQQIEMYKQENQELKKQLKLFDTQKRENEQKAQDDVQEQNQLRQQIKELNQQLDQVAQDNKSYKISYKTLEKQNQDLLQQVSTLKAEKMCQEFIKSQQSYIVSNPQIDSQQDQRIPSVLNTQETSEENLTENGSSNQLNYVNSGNNNSHAHSSNLSRFMKIQEKIINNNLKINQQSQIPYNSRNERSNSTSYNMLNGRNNNNYATPSRINQNIRSTNMSVGRERNGDPQNSIESQYANNSGSNNQNTSHQKQSHSSGSSANKLSSYRLSSVSRRAPQQHNSDDKIVSFANQDIPYINSDKLDEQFTESVTLDEAQNRKVSEESKYFTASQNSQRLHYQAQGKLTEVNNSPVINPFSENQLAQVPASSRTKSFSQYQNYYDVPNGGSNSKYLISPDKSEQALLKGKAPTIDSGQKEYLGTNRIKLTNVKGYLGESSDYDHKVSSSKNNHFGRLDQQQQQQKNSNLENQIYSIKLAQSKIRQSSQTTPNINGIFNMTYEQLFNQLQTLKDCQSNLEYEVNKLRGGGREEDNERKNMLNLELTIIKKEIAQIQARINML